MRYAVKRFATSIASIMAQAQTQTRVAYRDEELETLQVQGVSEDYLDFATFDAERGPDDHADRDHAQAPGHADRLAAPPIGCSRAPTRSTSRSRSPACRSRVVGVSKKKGAVVRPVARRVRGDSARRLSEAVRRAAVAGADGQAARRDAGQLRPGRSARRAARRSRAEAGAPDNFGIVASDSVLGIFQQATAGIAVVLVGIVGLSLLVGGIVIMNIMLMVVSERTREIGLRKALGAKRRDIMSQVLTESITLSLVGGIARRSRSERCSRPSFRR